MQKNEKSANEIALQNVYQSAKMGTDAIAKLMPKVRNEQFKSAMSAQLNGYQGFIREASDKLTAMNKAPEDAGLLQKIPADIGIIMGTAMDKSDSKIAEMMINGSVMGLSEIKKTMSHGGIAPDTEKLMSAVVAFEENNINNLKSFL